MYYSLLSSRLTLHVHRRAVSKSFVAGVTDVEVDAPEPVGTIPAVGTTPFEEWLACNRHLVLAERQQVLPWVSFCLARQMFRG